MGKVTAEYVRWVPKAEPSDLFPYAYNLKWTKTIDELKEVLQPDVPIDYMSFDTETTGLNAEEIDIVGYSFCLDGKTAYYVPVWHHNFELGEEAIDLIYQKMCNAKIVAMFNMRYDVRVMEYHGYTSLFKGITEMTTEQLQEELDKIRETYRQYKKKCPYNTTEDIREKHKLELSNKPFIKYDMTKVYVYDVQAVVYLADTNIKYPSLKASEEWYLGWRGASFEQTVSQAKDDRAITFKKDTKTGEKVIKDMNFFYLSPEEAYEYAAIDALGTYLLGIKCKPFYDEAKTSGKLDIECLMPLERFENELTLIDVDRLKEYNEILTRKIKEVQNRCWATAGKEFNLGSNKETNEVLKSLNIHTGITTKRGEMSTSKEAIQTCVAKLRDGDPAKQFLTDLTNYGTYSKQKSSYIDNIIEMAESNTHHKNRLRFSYKTTEVPSGRLAAGGDKKNQFFANCLSGDTMLYTINGLKQIKDIQIGDLVWNGEKFTKVLNYWNNGIQPIYKVTLENGIELKCTNNHKIYSILNNNLPTYNELSKLSAGDYIAVNSIPFEGINTNKIKSKEINRPKGELVSSPIELDLSDKDLWFLFGYILGDGCICSNIRHRKSMKDIEEWELGICWNYTTKKGVQEYIIKILDKYNIKYSIQHKEGTNLGGVIIKHVCFMRLLKELGFTSTPKNIPDFIFGGSIECRREYIKGLYSADGCRNGNGFLIKQSNKENSYKIGLLLSSLGIAYKIFTYDNHVYNIRITKPLKFYKEIGYFNMDDKKISNRFKIKIPKVLYNKYKNLTKHNNGYRNVFNNDCTDYIDLNTDIYDLNLLWYKIKSIEYINEDNVYDIETETHNFIGNSISLHNCNIQNITKPHVTSHYCVPEEAVKQYYPEIWEALDNSGTREECRTPLRYLDIEKINQLCKDNNIENYIIPEGATRWSYRIYGWVFSEEPWLIPGVEEFVVEGFIQDQNIRSTFLPDDNHYWVSLDFNAEEIRIPALWSGEPAWVSAFSQNKDVHKSTAVAIWGEENYSKDKRKLAKGANFGLLYGMTAHNFSSRFNMSPAEAQEFVDAFKSGLPTLFTWIGAIEKTGEKFGTVYTMFGRPRRVKSWFDTGDWSWVNFAKRTCVNTVVQGTGADILKIVMIRIFNKWYNNPKTGPMTKLIRFKSTIHDEINYQVYKDKEHNYEIFKKLVKGTMESMRVKLPEWPFPMEVGLSIGNRWGQSVDFNFDPNTLEILGPKKDPINDKDICNALNIKFNGEVEEHEGTDRSDKAIRDQLGDGWDPSMTISY